MAKNPPQPQDCGSEEGYTNTCSTTTWDVSGEWAPVPRSTEQGAFVLTAKWLQVQAKFLRAPPGKENSFRNLSPCPFSRHLRTRSSSQGYPAGKGRCSKGAASPSTSTTFLWSFWLKLRLAPNLQRKPYLISKTCRNNVGSNGRGKKEMTCGELEIIIYRAENILPHTYTHLSFSAVLVPSKTCTINVAWAELIQGWIQQKWLSNWSKPSRGSSKILHPATQIT